MDDEPAYSATCRPNCKVIACEVFRNALRYLGIDHKESASRIVYLPSHLHLHPQHLKQQLLDSLAIVDQEKTYDICLYGQCFPDIDLMLHPLQIERIKCGYCYEVLLGVNIHAQLMQEHPGTFFLEKECIENFENFCIIPLELDDLQMRHWYFEHYEQVIYIHQPLDPDLSGRVQEIANFLELDLQVLEADYSDLQAYLKKQDIL